MGTCIEADLRRVDFGNLTTVADLVQSRGTCHYVWTDVYMNREGQWQVVATQGSKVRMLSRHEFAPLY